MGRYWPPTSSLTACSGYPRCWTASAACWNWPEAAADPGELASSRRRWTATQNLPSCLYWRSSQSRRNTSRKLTISFKWLFQSVHDLILLVRFRCFGSKNRKQRLSSSFSFAPPEPCFGRSCEGSRSVFPSDTRSSSRKLHIDLYAGTDWRGWIPARRKKAVWGGREKKATANELLLIGRSSIRETLHYLLTRCCVLKGRTIITNWTCGRGGVCRCRGRKKGSGLFMYWCPSAGAFFQKGRVGAQWNVTGRFSLWRGLDEQRARARDSHVGYLCVITHEAVWVTCECVTCLWAKGCQWEQFRLVLKHINWCDWKQTEAAPSTV